MGNLTKHELSLREYYIGQMLAGVDASRGCEDALIEEAESWGETVAIRIIETVNFLLARDDDDELM